MKHRGRVATLSEEKRRKLVQEYFTTELSMEELAEKHGTTRNIIEYAIKKYRSEFEDVLEKA